MQKTIVILSGPSCAGKSPLLAALRRCRPEIEWGRPVLYTSRPPRPVEQEGVDYHFRSEEELWRLPPNRFVVARTRTILQAVDLDEMEALLERYGRVIYDAHPSLAAAVTSHPRVAERTDLRIHRVFLQPATLEEIEEAAAKRSDGSAQEAAAEMMLRKLIARARLQGTALTAEVMADLKVRAAAAWEEMLLGRGYDHVIVTHDGEESPHWRATPPSGEAGRALQQFAALLLSA